MSAGAARQKRETKDKKVIRLDKQKDGAINPIQGYDADELIFALDIGTRTVVGVVGLQDKDKFRVVAAEVVEHKSRAMLDGQIHDIKQVANVAAEIKSKLEKSLGVTLKRVAIAAAGRVLKTCQVRVEREIEQGREIEQEIISSIEMEGIQQAQLKLDEEMDGEEKTQFYCVGYSVINYYLNGYALSSPLGHRGKKIGVDILATFLPHIVVDSLYTVMGRIGLEVVSLTLEPIAAINVTIPRDLRLLNLALVDIGAGTSDIAITRDGSVVAYAMAPVAGDEITERIAQHYLVDFNTGENIKVSLTSKKDSITFVDILGKKQTVRADEVLEVIKPVIELLAVTISRKILEYNNKAPNAVFLIGGGSQVPGLTQIIAQQLKLPCERVVVRGREVIQNIKFNGRKLSGPESITPIGIAVTAHLQRGQDFLSVTINGSKVRLFNSRKLTVADALILIGFNANQLIGRTGKSISYILNGEKKIVRGSYGRAAEIYVNNNPASLETVLSAGDDINVVPAEDGINASIKVSDLAQYHNTGSITFNGSNVIIGSQVFINGRIANKDEAINNGDEVAISHIITLDDLLGLYEVNKNDFQVFVNDRELDYGYKLNNSDIVDCRLRTSQICPGEGMILDKELLEQSEKDTNQLIHEEYTIQTPFDYPGDVPWVTVNGKKVLLKGEKSQYIFVDIFNYIDFDLSKPQGNIVLRLNGRQAAFTDVIEMGDDIEVLWEK